MKQEYDASSIKVLRASEVIKLPYVIIQELQDEYKSVPPDFIKKGVEVCLMMGKLDYFVERYLVGDKTIPIDKEFEVEWKHHK